MLRFLPLSERRDLLAVAALSAVVLATFGSLLGWHIVGAGPRFDYHLHLELARTMASHPSIRTPHFLFQLLVIAVHAIVGDFNLAGFLVVLASCLVLAVILYATLRSALAAFALMIAAPIALLVGLDGHYYFGYLSEGSVYHNPTILLLKPLTIPLFVWSARFFAPPFRSSLKTIAMITLVVILSAVTKPSYLICLLPVLALMAFLRLVRKEPVDWRAMLAGVVIPATLLLAWQYWFNYNGGKTGIAFAPFVVARHFSSWLLPKFLLSIAFPLAVTLSFFRRALADVRMQLAWLGTVLGAFFFYCLIETGPDNIAFHGNFGWSGLIALFVLFFASTAFLLDQWRVPATPRLPLILSTAVLGAHVISGMVWYALSWQGRTFW